MPLDHISVDSANLIAVILEWCVYGASLPFFGLTLHELFTTSPKDPKINKPLFLIALLLFFLSTTIVSADIVDVLLRYTTFSSSEPGAYFQNIARPTAVVRGITYLCITILADAVVVYRCFIVWKDGGRWAWVIGRVLPWVLWVGLIAAGISFWASLLADGVSWTTLSKFAMGFFAFSLSTTLLSTGLLAYKIWHITQALSPSHSVLRKLLRVVIDSGIIYSVFLVIAMIVMLSESNIYYITTYIMSGIISITFYLTIIRLQRSNRKRCVVRSVFDIDASVLRVDVPSGDEEEGEKADERV